MKPFEPLAFERSFLEWADGAGCRSESGTFGCAPGTVTSFHRFTPAGRTSRLLLLLHGAGNDALFGWIGLFRRQLEQGTEIFTFDLPGHGRRTSHRFSGPAAITAAKHAVLAAVGERAGLPVHALGVSLGGSVLLGALPAVQDQLASAALVVAPLRIVLGVSSVLNEMRPANFKLVWRQRSDYGLTGLIPSFGPFKRDVYPLRLSRRSPGGPFGYVEVLNSELEEMRLLEAAAAVQIPTFLAYGTHDRVVPIEQGERLASSIPGAELHRIEGGTHLSTPMAEPLNSLLDQWLDRLTP